MGILGMTDSILKLFGYRRNIIYELKNKKSLLLVIGIAILFPLTAFLEIMAAAAGRGGIIRKYCVRKGSTISG
jgi:hypothetical protein